MLKVIGETFNIMIDGTLEGIVSILQNYHIYIFLMFILFVISISLAIKHMKGLTDEYNLIAQKLKEMADKDKQKETPLAIAAFNKWVKTNSYKLSISFRKSWKNYYANYMENTKNGSQITPDVYDFFLEEELVRDRGKRKIIDLLPGLFLTLGILGTFVGLVDGINGLNSQSSEELRDGVIGLMGGMKTAFYTSIVGILMSLAWQLIDRLWYYRKLTDNFTTLRSKLDHAFPTQSQETILQQMAARQKQQMEDFQTYMSDNIIPQLATNISKAFEVLFVPHLEETQTMMKSVLEQTNQNQMDGVKEMVDQFVGSLHEITGDQMKALSEALKQTVEWQEKVHREMSQLVQSLQDSAKEQSQMVEKTTVLTDRIHQYTDRISDYQSTLEKTVAELNETTERNRELQLSTAQLLEKMTSERQAFSEQFKIHTDTLKENVVHLNRYTELHNELHQEHASLMEQWNTSVEQLKELSETNSQYLASVKEQTGTFDHTKSELKKLLDDINKNSQNNLKLHDSILKMNSSLDEQRADLNQTQVDLRQQLSNQLEEVDRRFTAMQNHWSSTHDLISETNQQLSNSMTQFTEHMHQGLERTFEQFDQELTRAVQYLSRGVGALDELVRDLPSQMESFNHQVNQMNNDLGLNIQQANQSLTKAINELNKTTERLVQL